MSKAVQGLFVTGTDTTVGKTYVGALIARALAKDGRRVGVYKPAESGCRREGEELVAADAAFLWEAAGRPGDLEHVCPQKFAASLAPHLAAMAEERRIDAQLLREGLDYWRERSDVVIVEGAGGLMSPLGEEEYVADLALDFAFPLIIVARNALGTINHTLQTLIAAATFREGLDVAGIVLNAIGPQSDSRDESIASNRRELEARCVAPVLAEVGWGANRFDGGVDWYALAR